MADQASRRAFLIGVLSCGALTAAATYTLPGGKPRAQVRLRLLTGADSTGGRKLLYDMWNAANPDIQLEVDERNSPTGDQKTFMLDEAGRGRADLLNLDIIHLQEFAALGLISRMELSANRFLAPTIKAGRVADDPDRYWAAPFNTDVGVLYERVPANATASDIPSLSGVIDSLEPGSRGFVGQVGPGSSASNEAFVVNVLEHALSRDPDILNPDGFPVHDHNRWKNALTPLREAIMVQRVWAVDDTGNSLQAFRSERRPRYMRGWPVQYRELQQENDRDVREGRITVRPLPVGILGGQSLAVVARSRNQGQARQVIDFLTSDESQKVIAAHGLAPTRVDAYTDPNLKAFIPHLESIRLAVESAQPRAIHHGYGAFSEAVVRHMRPWLEGRVDDLPSQFVDDIRAALPGPS